MDALQFYVGRWSCLERKASDPPLSSTFTFAVESNLMRQWIARPKQGSMGKRDLPLDLEDQWSLRHF